MQKVIRGLLFGVLAGGLLWSGCSGFADSVISITHTITPNGPQYTQIIYDCNTGVLVTPDSLIQPSPGCDSWATNRYERPFNAGAQDEFYPDLDILGAELGQTGEWFYLRIEVFDLRDGEETPLGTYAIELDLDQDSRGDALVMAIAPSDDEWSVAGMKVWEDTNQDVGNKQPAAADHPAEGDSYDKLLFNEGVSASDPDVAWARFIPGSKTIIEIAFKAAVINYDPEFKWWVWAEHSMNPELMDYHDAIEHEDAGDVYASLPYFPSKDVYQVDNTCKALWGAPPDEDPSLCWNDPNVPPPPTPGLGTPTYPPPLFTPSPTDPGSGGSVTPTPTTPEGDGSFTPSPTTRNTSTNTPPGGNTPTPTDTPRTPNPTVTPTCGPFGNFLCTPTPTPTCGPSGNFPCTPTTSPSDTPKPTDTPRPPTNTPTATSCAVTQQCTPTPQSLY